MARSVASRMSSVARARSSAISVSTAAMRSWRTPSACSTRLFDDLAGVVAGVGELPLVVVERRLGFHARGLRLLEVFADLVLTGLQARPDRRPRLPREEREDDDERDTGPEDLVSLGEDRVLRLDVLGVLDREQQGCEHGGRLP